MNTEAWLNLKPGDVVCTVRRPDKPRKVLKVSGNGAVTIEPASASKGRYSKTQITYCSGDKILFEVYPYTGVRHENVRTHKFTERLYQELKPEFENSTFTWWQIKEAIKKVF